MFVIITQYEDRNSNQLHAGEIMGPFVIVTQYEDRNPLHAGEIMQHLVAHPEYKLLTLKNIPQMSAAAKEFSTYQWHGLLKHLRQMLIADAAMEEGMSIDKYKELKDHENQVQVLPQSNIWLEDTCFATRNL